MCFVVIYRVQWQEVNHERKNRIPNPSILRVELLPGSSGPHHPDGDFLRYVVLQPDLHGSLQARQHLLLGNGRALCGLPEDGAPAPDGRRAETSQKRVYPDLLDARGNRLQRDHGPQRTRQAAADEGARLPLHHPHWNLARWQVHRQGL